MQLGIAKADMKTSSFSITPNYTLNSITNMRSITSYSVGNMLSVKTHDFTKLSNIIQNATDSGANQIYGVRFYLENDVKVKNELMMEALQNGKKQASLIANSLGLGLGDVLSASVSDYSPSYNTVSFEKLNMRATSSSTPIEAGTLKLSSTANLAFAIRQ
ncbi:MAG: SIMPL domain-containing protein, partial [Acidaminococcaceae bacterium]